MGNWFAKNKVSADELRKVNPKVGHETVRVHYQESGGPNEVPISYEVSK